MDFSKLRQRITLLKSSGNEVNSMGEEVPKYIDFKEVWASVAPMTGREYQESQKLRSETTYKIAIRYVAGVTTDMKIRYKEKIMWIVSVLNVNERNSELQIVAFEVDENGKE